jgi:hypothetical protein
MTSVRSGRTMEEIAAGNVEWVEGRRFKDDGPARGKKRLGKGGDSASAKSPPPKFVAPQLATLVEAPPEGKDWLHEIKFDGYRVMAAVGGGRATIHTPHRPRLDGEVPADRAAARRSAVTSALIDGEAVVRDRRQERLRPAAAGDRRGQGRHRLLRLRSPVARRQGPPKAAAGRAQEAAGKAARGPAARRAAVLFRSRRSATARRPSTAPVR